LASKIGKIRNLQGLKDPVSASVILEGRWDHCPRERLRLNAGYAPYLNISCVTTLVMAQNFCNYQAIPCKKVFGILVTEGGDARRLGLLHFLLQPRVPEITRVLKTELFNSF
jgi:hypothetical protein